MGRTRAQACGASIGFSQVQEDRGVRADHQAALTASTAILRQFSFVLYTGGQAANIAPKPCELPIEVPRFDGVATSALRSHSNAMRLHASSCSFTAAGTQRNG